MRKITVVFMAVCFALSASAFAANKHHIKHKQHSAKPAAAAPAAPAKSETPAK